MAEPEKIHDTNKIIEGMLAFLELDNGVTFLINDEQRNKLKEGIETMKSNGFVFDVDSIFDMVAGEVDETKSKYMKISGYEAVNNALNDIFHNAETDYKPPYRR